MILSLKSFFQDRSRLENTFAATLLLYAGSLYISISLSALAQALLFVCALVYGFQHFQEIKRLQKCYPQSFYALLALTFLIFLSILTHWSDYEKPLKVIKSLRYLVFIGVIAPIASIYFKHLGPKKSHFLAKACVLLGAISLFISCVAGIIFYLGNWNYIRNAVLAGRRAAGLFSVSTSYACSAVLMFTLALGYFVASRKKFNNGILLSWILVCALGIYLSYTRAALLGFCVAAYFLLGLSMRASLLKKCAALLMALFVGMALWLGSQGGTSNRYIMALDSQSNSERLGQFHLSYLMLKDNPVFGVGFRLFEQNDPHYKKTYDLDHKDFFGNAHNNYLEMAATGGLPVLIAYIAFMLLLLFECKSLPSPYSHIGLAVWWAFQVAGFFQSNIIDAETLNWFTFALILFYAWKINQKDFARAL